MIDEGIVVSQKHENSDSASTPFGQDFEAWRDEIEIFCQQTLAQLQELTSGGSETNLGVSDESKVVAPRSSAPPQAPSTPTLSRPSQEAPAPRDLDSSQDRLANLKRELAAKLSNAARDES